MNDYDKYEIMGFIGRGAYAVIDKAVALLIITITNPIANPIANEPSLIP